MNLTLIGLWVIIIGYGAFLFFDGVIQAYRGGKTLVSVRLRRRIADSLFLLLILLAGLYYEITSQRDQAILFAVVLLSILVIWQGFRYPKWRLKESGFTFGGRFWRYENIAAIRLSEDGILVLQLQNGQNLILPVAKIDDLEKAAAFFTDADALRHLFAHQGHKKNEENKD